MGVSVDFIELSKLLSQLEPITEFLVTFVGIPIAGWKLYQEYKKSRKERELRTYESLRSGYIDFLKMCVDNHDIMPYTKPSESLNHEQISKRLYIFEILGSLFESAFYQYEGHDDDFKKQQWKGWISYIEWWIRQKAFRDAWEYHLNSELDSGFLDFMKGKFAEYRAQQEREKESKLEIVA